MLSENRFHVFFSANINRSVKLTLNFGLQCLFHIRQPFRIILKLNQQVNITIQGFFASCERPKKSDTCKVVCSKIPVLVG